MTIKNFDTCISYKRKNLPMANRKEFCIVEDSDGIWCRIDRTGKIVCRTTK